MTNPSIASRLEVQEIALYALPAEYLPAFSDRSYSKICCISLPVHTEDPICISSSSLFFKLMNSLPDPKMIYRDYNFTIEIQLIDTIIMPYSSPYYLILASCSDKQYFYVLPKAIGINQYGYLSAEEFPLLPVKYQNLFLVILFAWLCIHSLMHILDNCSL